MVEHVFDGGVPELELTRPWRRATYVAAAIAAVELLLLLVLGGVVLGPVVAGAISGAARSQVLATPKPASAVEQPARRTVAARLPRRLTKVMVLNGNGTGGAAASAAVRVRARGYRIGDVGNAPRADYARSLVMFRPGFRGEAERLARDLGVTIVAPLDGMRPAELRGAHAALILGSRN